MVSNYNPSDWYWQGTPAGHTALIYSSKSAAVVASIPSDWTNLGRLPTPWPKDATGVPTVAALDAVLTAAGLPPSGIA